MEVGAYEAKTHLPKLLERVGRGERITITRQGKPVADLRPIADSSNEDLRTALGKLDQSRARQRARRVQVTKENILSAIREGRR